MMKNQAQSGNVLQILTHGNNICMIISIETIFKTEYFLKIPYK